MTDIQIHNDPKNAITTGKWCAANKKELYQSIALSKNRPELGQESFLVFPADAYRNWPRASGINRCGYAHHVVVGSKLVVSIPGLKEAYIDAVEHGHYSGAVKSHLDRHLVELGLAHRDGNDIVLKDSELMTESQINLNFDEIIAFTEAKAEVIAITDMESLNKIIKTPEELMAWMQLTFQYDKNSSSKLLSPDELIAGKHGTCWDFTEFERAWCKKNYPGKFKIFYIVGDDGRTFPTHTFLILYGTTSVSWFEFSWIKHQGIHTFSTEEKAINDVLKKFKLGYRCDRYEIRDLSVAPTIGISYKRFMAYADEQPMIDIDTLDEKQATKDDYVPVFGIIKSYSQELLRADGSDKDSSEKNSMRFDRILKKLTRGDNYSHALVSLDPSLEKMYSFEDEGLELDGIHDRPSWLGTKSIYVTVMFVTKTERETMQAYLDFLENNAEDTVYGMSNLLTMMIGKPVKQDKRFVCSTITGYILSMGNRKNLQRDYSRLRPEDITLLPRAFYVGNFSDSLDFDHRFEEFTDKIAALKDEHWDEIDDYNNHLPRLMLKDNLSRLKRLDKIFDWIVKKL